VTQQKINQSLPDALRARRAELKLTQFGYVNHLNKLLADKTKNYLPLFSEPQLQTWEGGRRKPSKFSIALLSIIGEYPYISNM